MINTQFNKQEIAPLVEQSLALADQIEVHFTKAQYQVDKLTPSLLANAFRGELVPQNLDGKRVG